jgi:hypothetical protein
MFCRCELRIRDTDACAHACVFDAVQSATMGKTFFWVFAGMIVFQILVPPVVGLADNGDFGKVAGVFSLGAPPELEFKYMSTAYTFAQEYKQWAGYLSSEQAFAGAAVVLNQLVSKDAGLDIRIIGVIHAALYIWIWILAAPLLPRKRAPRMILTIAALLIFGDAFYAAMFNTFYMDTAALLGLLALAVGFLRTANGITPAPSRWLMLAGALVLITSKTQHALVGVIFIAALALPRIRKLTGLSSRAAAVAVLVLATAIGASLYWVPGYYRVLGAYNVIFYDILPHSKNVAADLASLGLDDSYRPYIGSYAFLPTSGMQRPEFIAAFARRTSNVALAGYYIGHPAVAFRILKSALSQAGRQRPPMGNFDHSAGKPEFAESSAFSLWSIGKRRLFEGRGGRYLWTSLVIFVCGGALAFRPDRSCFVGAGPLAAVLAGVAFVEMLASALVDVLEVIRHFFLFSVLWDCLVLLLAAMAITSWNERHTEDRTHEHAPCLQVTPN